MKQYNLEESKIIIVHYVNVSGMSNRMASETLRNYKALFGDRVENAIEYVIALTEGTETHIEFYSISTLDEITIEKLEQLKILIEESK